jgi:hypothetical protein
MLQDEKSSPGRCIHGYANLPASPQLTLSRLRFRDLPYGPHLTNHDTLGASGLALETGEEANPYCIFSVGVDRCPDIDERFSQ